MEHHEHDTHTHEHTHTHDHGHDHVHSHDLPGDKTAALLQYMLDHNIHHAAELNDIAARPGTSCSTLWSPSTRPTATSPPLWSC